MIETEYLLICPVCEESISKLEWNEELVAEFHAEHEDCEAE